MSPDIGNGQIDMHTDDVTIGMDVFDACDNCDSNENGADAHTSSISNTNDNLNENATAVEQPIDVKPIARCGLRRKSLRKRSRRNQASNKKRNVKRFKCVQCNFTSVYECWFKAHAQVH